VKPSRTPVGGDELCDKTGRRLTKVPRKEIARKAATRLRMDLILVVSLNSKYFLIFHVNNPGYLIVN
jgi:hypothetical protein